MVKERSHSSGDPIRFCRIEFRAYSNVLNEEQLASELGLSGILDSSWNAGNRTADSALKHMVSVGLHNDFFNFEFHQVEAELFKFVRDRLGSHRLNIQHYSSLDLGFPPTRVWLHVELDPTSAFQVNLNVELIRELSFLGCEFALQIW